MKHIHIDGYTFALDSKTGYYLSTRKIGSRRIRLHVYIWTKAHGQPEPGYDVHHIDGNKENNSEDNLMLMLSMDHNSKHMKERFSDPLEYDKQITRLEDIRRKAREWHSSPDGLAWHKKHYNEMGSQMHKELDRICINCGKAFKTKQARAKYCSSTCRNIHRTANKLDCIDKTCIVCGKIFKGNKWRDTPTCGRSCGATLGHRLNKG